MKETKFKQTEVGMIPSDWEVKFLSEIGSFSKGSGISRSESNSGNLPAIRYGEIYTKHNDYIKAFYSHISKEVANKSTRIYRGDVLFSASGETKEDIGKTVAFLESIEAYAGGDIIIMSPKCPVNSMFLGYILNFPAIAKQKAMKAQGDAVVHITTDSLRKLQVCIPKTTKEQQRIANALSDVDTLIANLEKLIVKKKNIKQGAMQQLLTGKKRLPGFASDERQEECHSERSAKREESSGYKMTELGMIPSDWEVKTFGELFDILPNNTLSRAELNEDSGSFKNVHYGDVLVKFPEWIDCSKNTLPFINSGAKFNHTALQDGDVIIADTAEDETVGKSTEIYNVGKMKIVSGLHTIPIRPKKKFASKWLGYFINSACWHDQILPFITGTKVSAISKTAIAETKIFYPAKIDEQTAIANVLSDMDTEIATLETKLAKYRKLKTGMMQQLLTGKIRLIK